MIAENPHNLRILNLAKKLVWEYGVYKNLSGDGLGVSARQNELIELALTYGFRGIDVDMAEMFARSEAFGMDFAKRFITSAAIHGRIRIGSFKMPISMSGDDTQFAARLPRLTQIAEVAASIGATRCFYDVPPGSNTLAFQDYFELCRNRLGQIADIFAKHNISLGLGVAACPEARKTYEYQFIFQIEPLLKLVKTIGRKNVGVSIDLWNWQIGDGGLDQIEDLAVSQIINVKLADIPNDADPVKISSKQRLLPGTTTKSKAAKLLELLKQKNYDGPVSAAPHASQFSGLTRDTVVQRTSEALDAVFEAAGISTAVSVG